MSRCESRIKSDCLTKKSLSRRIIFRGSLFQMPQTTLVSGPGVEASWWRAHRTVQFGVGYSRGDGDRHRFADLVLQCENVGELAVVALCPDVLAGVSLDQLCGDADTVAGFTQAAFEHVAHAELAPDLLYVDSAPLVRKTRIARDHEQGRIPGQCGDDVLDHAVGEVFLFR